jgi:ATP-dependent helicase YprA (DUF1998 family)
LTAFFALIDAYSQEFTRFDSFQGHQEPALRSLLARNDVLLVSPTGSGKSLTFQLLGYLLNAGFALVITPTKALMESHMKDINAYIAQSKTDLIARGLGPAFRERKTESEADIIAMLKSNTSKLRWCKICYT